ncbi:unnamed protein product [Orchesella dallaii]|uniref:Chitin-binding type-2 domain-containing protein n=1 Tax=Orchesella dallaii TaxID=48710 RepID=A0ABP1RG61_9HEXA
MGLLCYYFYCFTMLTLETVSQSPKPRVQQVSDICCYMGKYRIGLIPRPFRCDYFNQCRPVLNADGHYRFDPISIPCEQGLFYDFRECKCLRAEEVKCFDARFSDHIRGKVVLHKYKCIVWHTYLQIPAPSKIIIYFLLNNLFQTFSIVPPSFMKRDLITVVEAEDPVDCYRRLD